MLFPRKSLTKILALAGSARKDSFNKKLVKIAIAGAKAAGAEVTYLDFRDLPLTLYDGDNSAERLDYLRGRSRLVVPKECSRNRRAAPSGRMWGVKFNFD